MAPAGSRARPRKPGMKVSGGQIQLVGRRQLLRDFGDGRAVPRSGGAAAAARRLMASIEVRIFMGLLYHALLRRVRIEYTDMV